jgi:integrase
MCCPGRLLRAWLEAADIARGPLFLICQTRSIPLRRRLQTQSIRKAVKDAAQGIGLDEMIGAHSLRAGCLTWLDQQGISPFRIMKHSGHQNVHSLLNYIRPPATPTSSPLMGTIWAR